MPRSSSAGLNKENVDHDDELRPRSKSSLRTSESHPLPSKAVAKRKSSTVVPKQETTTSILSKCHLNIDQAPTQQKKQKPEEVLKVCCLETAHFCSPTLHRQKSSFRHLKAAVPVSPSAASASPLMASCKVLVANPFLMFSRVTPRDPAREFCETYFPRTA